MLHHKQLTYNFNSKEFDSPDIPYSGLKMNKEFINLLQTARTKAGIPFIIISGYRSKEHNALVGGVSNSSHLKGLATDILVKNSGVRYIILKSLISVGLYRIGIHHDFIHVDIDNNKPKNLIWLY